MPSFNSLRALVVDIIRILWDHGFFQQVEWLIRIHDNWFAFWVDWKTIETMVGVDREIERVRQPSGVDAPIYTETDTEQRLTAPWHDQIDDEASL